MDKKVYIAPEMEVEVLETEVLMNAGSPGLGMSNDTFDTADDGDGSILSTGRRGTWGNFWN